MLRLSLTDRGSGGGTFFDKLHAAASQRLAASATRMLGGMAASDHEANLVSADLVRRRVHVEGHGVGIVTSFNKRAKGVTGHSTHTIDFGTEFGGSRDLVLRRRKKGVSFGVHYTVIMEDGTANDDHADAEAPPPIDSLPLSRAGDVIDVQEGQMYAAEVRYGGEGVGFCLSVHCTDRGAIVVERLPTRGHLNERPKQAIKNDSVRTARVEEALGTVDGDKAARVVKLRALFQYYDVNKNGMLDVNELECTRSRALILSPAQR